MKPKIKEIAISLLFGIILTVVSMYVFADRDYSSSYPKGFPFPAVNYASHGEEKINCITAPCPSINYLSPITTLNYVGAVVDIIFWSLVSYGVITLWQRVKKEEARK